MIFSCMQFASSLLDAAKSYTLDLYYGVLYQSVTKFVTLQILGHKLNYHYVTIYGT